MSYKTFYFYCLANVELKPHTKVLKNLFRNMALKNLCVTTILPSYFSLGWPQTNVVKYFLCIGSPNYTRTSPPARKMLLFSSNLNMQNSVVMLTFPDFDYKYPLWANLVQKIKIVSLF